MKNKSIILSVVGSFVFLGCVSSLAHAAPLKLAIVDLGVMNIEPEKSIKLTKLIREEFRKLKKYSIVPRSEIEEGLKRRDILTKQRLKQYECTFVPCAEKVARASKANYALIGRLIKKVDKHNKGFVVFVQVVSVVSRRIEYILNYSFLDIKELDKVAPYVAKRLDMWFIKDGETEESVKERRLKLAKLVEEDYRKYWKADRERIKFKHKPGECPEGMVLIPAGAFKSGSLKSDTERYDDEEENKEVFMDEYCIDKYEYPNKKGARPLVKQEWFGAKTSCEEAGKTLCSELQWEKACKGPKNLAYPYGEKFDSSKCNTPYIKAGKTMFDRKTKPIGSNEECKSGYGVYDMSGNVYEWVNNSYEGEFYHRIIRGGSWADSKTNTARCATRNYEVPFIHDDTIGFRCCLN